MAVLTHIAMQVVDVEECQQFYQEYCGMQVCNQRGDGSGVVWLAEPGRERELIVVLIPGGTGQVHPASDSSHLGFALDSRAAVDRIAERARSQGMLLWEPREEPYPVGYYCGVRDPDSNAIEFSYGQPLGPGAESIRP